MLRALLAEAVGANDNGRQAPEFPVMALADDIARQRDILVQRVIGFLRAEGATVEKEFNGQVFREFGEADVTTLTPSQLSALLTKFYVILNAARINAALGKGRGE